MLTVAQKVRPMTAAPCDLCQSRARTVVEYLSPSRRRARPILRQGRHSQIFQKTFSGLVFAVKHTLVQDTPQVKYRLVEDLVVGWELCLT